MADRPYSRVYWEVMQDERFDGIREDSRTFGTWTLLLVLADMAWPVPAFIPPTAMRKQVALLAGRGLIELLSGGRYRIHGMDRERTTRSDKARQSARLRYDRSATAARPHTDRTASQDETRLDETSRDETRPPILVVIDYIEGRTGRSYSFGNGSKVHDALSADVRDFGADPVLTAMRADTTSHPDIGQLVFGASRRLHPLATVPTIARDDAAERFDRGVAATQRMLARQRGETA